MRWTVMSLSALLLATGSAFAQVPAGVKQHIQGNLNNAVDQHNQDLENAMNGNDNPAPVPPPAPVPAKTADGLLAVKAGWMTRKAADGQTNVRLYFAYPQALSKDAPAPGLIVLQEWWGVNDDIQERTRDFAAHGFYAVAPDLYDGKVTDDPTQAAALKNAMTNPHALVDMKAGLDLLTEEEGNGVVDAARVGAIGWCMGGEQALLLSLADSRVKATGIFYGPLVTDAEQLKKLQGPVLGVFGNNDAHPSPADVQKFKDGLAAAGKTDVTIYQFDGVGHAFASKAAVKMGAYNPEKAKDAWAKTWVWLDAKLLKK